MVGGAEPRFVFVWCIMRVPDDNELYRYAKFVAFGIVLVFGLMILGAWLISK